MRKFDWSGHDNGEGWWKNVCPQLEAYWRTKEDAVENRLQMMLKKINESTSKQEIRRCFSAAFLNSALKKKVESHKMSQLKFSFVEKSIKWRYVFVEFKQWIHPQRYSFHWLQEPWTVALSIFDRHRLNLSLDSVYELSRCCFIWKNISWFKHHQGQLNRWDLQRPSEDGFNESNRSRVSITPFAQLGTRRVVYTKSIFWGFITSSKLPSEWDRRTKGLRNGQLKPTRDGICHRRDGARMTGL